MTGGGVARGGVAGGGAVNDEGRAVAADGAGAPEAVMATVDELCRVNGAKARRRGDSVASGSRRPRPEDRVECEEIKNLR